MKIFNAKLQRQLVSRKRNNNKKPLNLDWIEIVSREKKLPVFNK